MTRAGRQPMVSVITVVRDGMPFIEANLASVRAQTWPHIEHVVVDGGSTDGTVERIRAAESSLAFWVSEVDSGIADAFNKGIVRARGDYLLFLNADDRLASPDVVALIAQDIAATGWPELIYGDCRILERGTVHVRYVARVLFEPGAFRRGATLPHPSLFMHKSYFERFGLYDTSFRVAMDFELLLRGATSVRLVRVPRVVTDVSDGGVSVTSEARGIEEIARAMRKNGVLSSDATEWAARVYFHARRRMRRALQATGLYPLLEKLRPARGTRA